ncbi:MAG: hypothetical protein ACTHNQ_01760 [Microbacterium sp.]|uniref:hypothetical protein n=1 Tax=Microbacterium sp. TaxID=51671 RepID=UPI003F813894
MDARTGLVIGGMTAVAASVAVVCAVAMTNTAALKDSPATTVASARILVPASSSTPTATPTPTQPEIPLTSDEAEIVEAPAPTEVEPSAPSAHNPPRTPPPAEQPQVAAPGDDVDSVIEAARAAGTWDSLRAWATANGWSNGRIESLIDRLERAAEAERQKGDSQLQAPDKGTATQKDSAATDGGSAERLLQAPLASTNQDGGQKPSHPQHPAHAGSNGNGSGAGPDAKKDQPRNSPDKRG